jgi:hypothetical protein
VYYVVSLILLNSKIFQNCSRNSLNLIRIDLYVKSLRRVELIYVRSAVSELDIRHFSPETTLNLDLQFSTVAVQADNISTFRLLFDLLQSLVESANHRLSKLTMK